LHIEPNDQDKSGGADSSRETKGKKQTALPASSFV
jgi:hypothetical protein